MQYMVPVLILMAVVPTAYYFFFFRRIIKTLGQDPNKKICIGIEILLSLVVWHFTCQVTTTGAVFLYTVLLADLLVLLIDFLIRKISRKSNEEAGRKIWGRIVGLGLIPVILVTVSFVYGTFNIRNVIETRYTVTTSKEIPEEGFRVCFLSDVHCGIALDAEDYERISRDIEACNVDTVILGGDLLDFNSEQEEVEAMFASFGSIKTKKGIYYIFGNHDRTGDYKESVFTEEYIIDQCEKNGITVLQDELVDFENGILMAGREDATTKYGRVRKTPEELLEGVDKSKFLLIADHQPTDYPELAACGADLIIGGHLHAGQLFPYCLLLVPYNQEHVIYGRYRITPEKNYRMDADGPATEGEGTSTGIITSGLAGWSYEVRTSGNSEYCIIDIVPEDGTN